MVKLKYPGKSGTTVRICFIKLEHHRPVLLLLPFFVDGGGYAYRLCPASMPLTEECFKAHHLDFVPEKAGLLFEDGSVEMIQPVHVNQGTTPPNSTWAMIPVAPTKLGPTCIPGPHDDPKAPNSCDPKNNPTTPCGCTPCPQTPGSDCSRCDNCYEEPAYPPFRHDGKPVSGVGPVVGIMDVVKIPSNLPPGEYVLGWRYDCEVRLPSIAVSQQKLISICLLFMSGYGPGME